MRKIALFFEMIDGKICSKDPRRRNRIYLIDRNSNILPNEGETWECEIIKECKVAVFVRPYKLLEGAEVFLTLLPLIWRDEYLGKGPGGAPRYKSTICIAGKKELYPYRGDYEVIDRGTPIREAFIEIDNIFGAWGPAREYHPEYTNDYNISSDRWSTTIRAGDSVFCRWNKGPREEPVCIRIPGFGRPADKVIIETFDINKAKFDYARRNFEKILEKLSI